MEFNPAEENQAQWSVWFMKGKKISRELSESISISFTLLETPLPDVRIAAVTDEGTIADAVLLDQLPHHETAAAAQRSAGDERRHLLFRRLFQRVAVAEFTGWKAPLSTLPLHHATDTAPRCDVAPDLALSFSSSGKTYLAAVAPAALFGIDVEARRDIADAHEIAARFFTPAEAALVSGAPPGQQSEVFQTIWCAKEAGLKARGRGIVSGLNTFTLERTAEDWQVHDSEEPDGRFWQLWYLSGLPGHIVAVMHRSRTNSRLR